MDKLRDRAGPWPEHDGKIEIKKGIRYIRAVQSNIYSMKFTVYITHIFTLSENARVDLV